MAPERSSAGGRPLRGHHELDAPPWKRVELTLMATSRAIRRAYDSRLAALGLNLSEASALSFVHERGPVTQTQLGVAMGMNRASAGAVVDALGLHGFVRRTSDPSDRRVWLVDATPAGRRVATLIAEIDEVLRSELRSGISRSDRQQLADTLVRLQQNLAGILSETETESV